MKANTKPLKIEDHILLHSPEIQEQIKQSENDIASGRYMEFDSDKIDEMLDWLYSEEEKWSKL